MHDTRTNIATTLGINIGTLSFIRYMLLNIPLIYNWQAIHKHRKHYINENIFRANLKRRQYNYDQGHKFLNKLHNPTKLVVRTTSHYTIGFVHVNVTVTIEIRPGITKRINIRRVVPFH